MKNWAMYEEEIKAIGIDDFAITKDGEVNECLSMNCSECEFQRLRRKCSEVRVIWLYKEYEEPEIDWSKVPVDTPIYVRDMKNTSWMPRHFAKIENGKVYAWHNGYTSFSHERAGAKQWKYAKLAEDTNERD